MNVFRVFALLVFCVVLGTFGFVESQQTEPPTISLSAVAAVDLDWLDTAGNPTTLETLQWASFPATGEMVPLKVLDAPPVKGTNQAALKPVLEGLPAGPVRISARVKNAAAWSTWTEPPITAVLVLVPPKPGTGCRLLSR